MHNTKPLISTTVVLVLLLQPAAIGDPPGGSLTECPTGLIDGVLKTISTTESSEAAPESQNETADDAGIFPSYIVCNESVEGGCTASETVDVTVTSSAQLTWRFELIADTQVSTAVTTYIHCEGVIEVDVLNRGGLGIRTVETLIGDARHEDLRGRSHCQYVAQVDNCRTHHEGRWTADRVVPGRLISSSGTIAVCGALTIHNGEGAVVNTGTTRSLTSLITENHHWEDTVCDSITFTVRDDGALFF